MSLQNLVTEAQQTLNGLAGKATFNDVRNFISWFINNPTDGMTEKELGFFISACGIMRDHIISKLEANGYRQPFEALIDCGFAIQVIKL